MLLLLLPLRASLRELQAHQHQVGYEASIAGCQEQKCEVKYEAPCEKTCEETGEEMVASA